MELTNTGGRRRQSRDINNHEERNWELTTPSAIKKEDKEQIKTRALQAGVVEPAPLLALHNALMIAKIMRFEFPQDWYARVPSILGRNIAC